MIKRKGEILQELPVYEGYLKVYEGLIKYTTKDGKQSTYRRQKIKTNNAVAGLVYNKENQTVVLVSQYRYPTHTDKTSGFIYEAVAGKIDKGETPIEAFRRECLEEVGYKIDNSNIMSCNWCYSSPGYSSEKLHYFLVTVTNKDKVKNAGGGLEDEHEDIDIIEMPYLAFKGMMDYMDDSKLKFLAYEAHHRKLFDK